MSIVPNDYEYRRIAIGSAEDGRRWELEECLDLTDGKGVGFRVITTQRGDAIGQSYRDGSAFVGGVLVAHGDEIHIEADTVEELTRELKDAGFSESDLKEIIYSANATSLNTVRGRK